MPLIPALGKQRQVDICEFKASLSYRVSSRTSQGYTEKPYLEKPTYIHTHTYIHMHTHIYIQMYTHMYRFLKTWQCICGHHNI